MDLKLNTPFQFHPRAGVVCAGQPDAEGFRAAAQAGIKAVLNMRPDAEMDWDEAALLAELGLEYVQIPVASPADLSSANVDKLNEFLQRHQGEGVLVHCASSNRVGALMALAAARQGASPDEAMQVGLAAGLSNMQPLVASLLHAQQS